MPSDAAKNPSSSEKKDRSCSFSLVAQCTVSVVRSISSAVQNEACAVLYADQI